MISRPPLVVHWLQLHSPDAEGPGSVPDQRTHSTCFSWDLAQPDKYILKNDLPHSFAHPDEE